MKEIPVIILGVGGVGRELVRQIVDARAVHQYRAGCSFNVVCVADSTKYVSHNDAFSDNELLEIVRRKGAGQQFGESYTYHADLIDRYTNRSPFGIVVDVTATKRTLGALLSSIDVGWGVVLANKKPLAGSLSSALPLYRSRLVRYESTVGAGQPVIATLQYLLDTNDSIRRIEGQLSGSLGYICHQLDSGITFSEALAKARESGYTEPDPREDLAGNDVMRKAIILGRTAGLEMSEEDISVESLFSEELASLDVEHFMRASGGMDDLFAQRVAEAATNGNVLRYVAAIEDGKAGVGLKPVKAGSTLADLKYVSFQTDRYDDEPLLVGGKGAGVGITAAGVIGDMVQLCREHA